MPQFWKCTCDSNARGVIRGGFPSPTGRRIALGILNSWLFRWLRAKTLDHLQLEIRKLTSDLRPQRVRLSGVLRCGGLDCCYEVFVEIDREVHIYGMPNVG